MRCEKEAMGTLMSMFNQDIICMDCKAKEREHPDYGKAEAADVAAIRDGNTKFKGIGKPEDL